MAEIELNNIKGEMMDEEQKKAEKRNKGRRR